MPTQGTYRILPQNGPWTMNWDLGNSGGLTFVHLKSCSAETDNPGFLFWRKKAPIVLGKVQRHTVTLTKTSTTNWPLE